MRSNSTQSATTTSHWAILPGESSPPGDNNIYIGNVGAATESNTIRIGGNNGAGFGSQTMTLIAGITGTPVTGTGVVVDPNRSAWRVRLIGAFQGRYQAHGDGK
jgi:hypothetical protein